MQFPLILLTGISSDVFEASVTTPFVGFVVSLGLKGAVLYESWNRYGFSDTFGKGKKRAVLFGTALLADQAFGEMPILEFLTPGTTIAICVLEYELQKNSLLVKGATKIGKKKLSPKFLNSVNRHAHLLQDPKKKNDGEKKKNKNDKKSSADGDQQAEAGAGSADQYNSSQYHTVSSPDTTKSAPSVSGAADSYQQEENKKAA